jgi:hypothetical protein
MESRRERRGREGEGQGNIIIYLGGLCVLCERKQNRCLAENAKRDQFSDRE